MTNAEKFEEVFGFKVDEYPGDPCDIVDHEICVSNGCDDCPIRAFWGKEYGDDDKS